MYTCIAAFQMSPCLPWGSRKPSPYPPRKENILPRIKHININQANKLEKYLFCDEISQSLPSRKSQIITGEKNTQLSRQLAIRSIKSILAFGNKEHKRLPKHLFADIPIALNTNIHTICTPRIFLKTEYLCFITFLQSRVVDCLVICVQKPFQKCIKIYFDRWSFRYK